MSADTDGTTEENRTATAPAEAIDNFGDLTALQTTVHQFSVVNLRPGDDEDSLRCYQVNVHDRTCTCQHGQMNEDDQIPCKHLAYVIARTPIQADISSSLVSDVNNVVRDVRSAAESTMDAAQAMANGQATSSGGDSSGSSGGSSDDSSDDGSGGVVKTDGVQSNDAQEQLVNELQEWFENAAQYNDYDARIVECKWGEADGDEGIVVDRVPFGYDEGDEYYADNEWQDKEGFEEERDALTEAILSPRDEFEWFEEPDYSWFIREDDVTEVLG